MRRAAARFTQAEIARALRAIKATGGGMRVRLDLDGAIIIETDNQQEQPKPVLDTPNYVF